MSVTFWCPDAPTRKVVPYPDQDPDFIIDESLLPEVNVSNFNARALIEMYGLESNDELLGSIEPAQMDAVIARLEALLGCSEERASFLEPTTVNGHVVSLAYTPSIPHDKPVASTLGQLLSQRLATTVTAGGSPEDEERAAVLDTLLPSNEGVMRALADKRRTGPQIISMGRDDEYLRRQTERFLDLFRQAKDHNYQVCWG